MFNVECSIKHRELRIEHSLETRHMLHEERDFATNRHEQCGLVGDNTALVGCQCHRRCLAQARRARRARKARQAGTRSLKFWFRSSENLELLTSDCRPSYPSRFSRESRSSRLSRVTPRRTVMSLPAGYGINLCARRNFIDLCIWDNRGTPRKMLKKAVQQGRSERRGEAYASVR